MGNSITGNSTAYHQPTQELPFVALEHEQYEHYDVRLYQSHYTADVSAPMGYSCMDTSRDADPALVGNAHLEKFKVLARYCGAIHGTYPANYMKQPIELSTPIVSSYPISKHRYTINTSMYIFLHNHLFRPNHSPIIHPSYRSQFVSLDIVGTVFPKLLHTYLNHLASQT